MQARTKIEISPAIVRRVSGLDDLARIFCPDNARHQRAFAVLWLSIKYSDMQFLPSCQDLPAQYQVSPRVIEIVRAKMKKLGHIRRISHYNPAFGHRSGWTFSPRFRQAIASLSEILAASVHREAGKIAERKDRDALLYL